MAAPGIFWAQFGDLVVCDGYPQNLEQLPALVNKAEVFLQKCAQYYERVDFHFQEIIDEGRESSRALTEAAEYLGNAVTRWKQHSDKRKDALAQVQQELKSNESERDLAKRDCEELTSTIEKLREEKAGLQHEIGSLNAEKTRLSNEVKDLAKSVPNVRGQGDELDKPAQRSAKSTPKVPTNAFSTRSLPLLQGQARPKAPNPSSKDLLPPARRPLSSQQESIAERSRMKRRKGSNDLWTSE